MSDERKWRRLLRRLMRKKSPYVKIGVLASQGGDQTTESGATMIEIATYHELGAPRAGIPQRSFLRGTVDAKEDELREMIEKLARQVVEKGKDPEEMLDVLGQWMVAEIKKRITESIPPPLKPGTIERKGSSVPLIDKGRLLNSVTHEVAKGR